MTQPIPAADLKCPRQDFPLAWGGDLEFLVDLQDADGDPWPLTADATAHIRLGSKTVPDHEVPCIIDGSTVHVHVDHAIVDTIRTTVEYTVLTRTPTAGDDPILDEPWLVGLLRREKLA